METFGSQKRELLSESGYILYKDDGEYSEYFEDDDGVILQEVTSGKLEYWFKNDNFAGYTIEIDGIGYEFVKSIKE